MHYPFQRVPIYLSYAPSGKTEKKENQWQDFDSHYIIIIMIAN